MFNSVDQVTFAQGLRITQTFEQLKSYCISLGLNRVKDDIEDIKDKCDDSTQFKVLGKSNERSYILGLMAGTELSNNVKPFFNPIEITLDENVYLIVDMRSCTRFDKRERTYVINDGSMFRREAIRVGLEGLWRESPKSILLFGNIQIKLYAEWIASALSKTYALNVEQNLRLTVGAGLFYLSQFTKEDRFKVDQANQVLARQLRLSLDFVRDVTMGIGWIKDATEFVSLLDNIVGESARLRAIDVSIFINALSGSWFGPNFTAIVATAVEYPPMFNYLLYIAFTDRNTRTSGIGRMCQPFERKPEGLEYINLVRSTLHDELNEIIDMV